MRKAFKYRLRPTRPQRRMLEAMLTDHAELYNAALEERRTAWSKAGVSITYTQQSAQLKHIRRDDTEGQGRWSFSSQQATLRRLNRAFENFFRRVRQGQTPGFPRFRSRHRFDSVTWPSDGDGCKWIDGDTKNDGVSRVRLQGVGTVRVHRHRPTAGRIKTLTVKREGPKWYLVLSVETALPDEVEKTTQATGVDMGVTHFATTAQGEHVTNNRALENSEEKLASAQRALARYPRSRKGDDRSSRHRQAARKVAKLHRKVADTRRDYAHKTALELVRRFDVIAVEKLSIQNMTKAPAPKPDPGNPGQYLPNGAANKAVLNKRIVDAAWGQFIAILTAKAEWAGREVRTVDPRNTSRTCFECKHVDAASRDGEKFECTACGHTDHADVNAAKNIAYRAGLVLGGHGI
ncbi:RNA-guided endonuclease InsQ/TnpB family protein [Salininema proteolyticum]|uniref:RNA-guided endonuclease InsQ/TnpB family protein n=1 Tax=Salininema proteolyticum TaxID=1607685 RepID=A0ABV8U3Q6_9ACTN